MWFLPALGVNPGVCLVRHFGQQQQVVATERIGGFPDVAVLVEAVEGDVVTNASFRIVSPDRGLDVPEPDLVYWFVLGWHK